MSDERHPPRAAYMTFYDTETITIERDDSMVRITLKGTPSYLDTSITVFAQGDNHPTVIDLGTRVDDEEKQENAT